jgi:hypothetical protein
MDNFNSAANQRNNLMVLVLIGGFILAVFIILVAIFIRESNVFESTKAIPLSPTPAASKPTEQPVDLSVDYSSIDELVPGQSTFDQILDKNGKPDSIERNGNQTLLFYDTPIPGRFNTISLVNDRMVYSIENVYGDYRGSLPELQQKYGESDLKLYMQNNSYPWDVYLSSGIAIENDGKDVGAILYFVPQSEQEFTNTIGKELGLSETPGEEE